MEKVRAQPGLLLTPLAQSIYDLQPFMLIYNRKVTWRTLRVSRKPHLGSRSLAGSPLCPTHAPTGNPHPHPPPTRSNALSATLPPECESLSVLAAGPPSANPPNPNHQPPRPTQTIRAVSAQLHGHLGRANRACCPRRTLRSRLAILSLWHLKQPCPQALFLTTVSSRTTIVKSEAWGHGMCLDRWI